MANVKISALAAASAPDGTELVPIVQGGTTKRTTTLGTAKTLLAQAANAWVGTQVFGAGTVPLWDGVFTIATTVDYGTTLVLTDAVADDTDKAGAWYGAPYHNADLPWTGIVLDLESGSSDRGIWIGGGGFSRPDATTIYFSVAPTYDQTPNLGVTYWTMYGSGALGVLQTSTPPSGVNWNGANNGALFVTAGRLKWLRDDSTVDIFLGAAYATAVSGITVTASPFNYQNTTKFNGSVIVQGGTVSKIEFSRDNAAFFDCGVTQGMFSLSPSDHLKVTYSSAPTMTFVPR